MAQRSIDVFFYFMRVYLPLSPSICLQRLSECLSRIFSRLKAKTGAKQAHNRLTASSLRVDYDDITSGL